MAFVQKLNCMKLNFLKYIPTHFIHQVISLKPIRTWREIRNDVCPVSVICFDQGSCFVVPLSLYFVIISQLVQALSLQQLERIVGMYWDDMNGTNIISAEVS